MEVEFRKHLPPYRSLLTPDAQYDYRTHLLVQLSPLDLAKVLLAYQNPNRKQRLLFKMKYKLLLSDVSRKALLLLMNLPRNRGLNCSQGQNCSSGKNASQNCSQNCSSRKNAPLGPSFAALPPELQLYVFDLVDHTPSYRNCLTTCLLFYHLAKPFLFRKVRFTLTYRFAQFVTYLRLNGLVGSWVLEIDLSGLKPGNWELEELLEDENLSVETQESVHNVWAGWRDWKFKNNPSFTLHPYPPTPRPEPRLAGPPDLPFPKRIKFSHYFKRKRKRSHPPVPQQHNAPARNTHKPSAHPKTNKFLLGYLASKDVPIGYIVHLVNLCPNMQKLNLGSLLLSTDYRINTNTSLNCQHFDLMNNFSPDLLKTIDSLTPAVEPQKDLISVDPPKLSASLVFSMSFSKPIRKYNSLLPPLPKSVRDLLYLSKGDGLVFLSDLNLKSISSSHLEMVNESEILRLIGKRASSLKHVGLSNMIWINLKHVKEFLGTMLEKELQTKKIRGKEYLLYKGHYFDLWDNYTDTQPKNNAITFDLSGSGMYKNLLWAKQINLSTKLGQHLVQKILNDELLSPFDESVLRERHRMGRVGENYFS